MWLKSRAAFPPLLAPLRGTAFVTRTRLVCTLDHFHSIREHPLLAPALRLGRCVNALRSLSTAVVPTRVIPEEERVRQQQNILLHLGATLYETLLVLDDLGPDLGQLESARTHLVSLRRDSELREFRDRILAPIRNTVAFHFDSDVLPRSFADLQFAVVVWSSVDESARSSTYFELADHALIPATFTDGDYPDFMSNYARYLNDTIVHTGYVCRAIEAVLTEVATVLGFHSESSAPPSDGAA